MIQAILLFRINLPDLTSTYQRHQSSVDRPAISFSTALITQTSFMEQDPQRGYVDRMTFFVDYVHDRIAHGHSEEAILPFTWQHFIGLRKLKRIAQCIPYHVANCSVPNAAHIEVSLGLLQRLTKLNDLLVFDTKRIEQLNVLNITAHDSFSFPSVAIFKHSGLCNVKILNVYAWLYIAM